MGWANSHLHQFTDGKHAHLIGVPIEDDFDEMEDSHKIKINSLLNTPKENIEYEYDFGDGWEHVITLDKLLEPEKGKTYPVPIGGAMG